MGVFTKDYIFNWAEETVWAVVIGIVAVAGPMILALDADTVGAYGVEEWKTWGIVVLLASGRIAGAIIVNALRKLFAAR